MTTMSRYSIPANVPADGVHLHAVFSQALIHDPLRPKLVDLILEAKTQNHSGNQVKHLICAKHALLRFVVRTFTATCVSLHMDAFTQELNELKSQQHAYPWKWMP